MALRLSEGLGVTGTSYVDGIPKLDVTEGLAAPNAKILSRKFV